MVCRSCWPFTIGIPCTHKAQAFVRLLFIVVLPPATPEVFIFWCAGVSAEKMPACTVYGGALILYALNHHNSSFYGYCKAPLFFLRSTTSVEVITFTLLPGYSCTEKCND